MKVSLSWLKELVDFELTPEDLANKLSLTSIGVKQQTEDYLELDLTYNRGDLLSLRGVAYEVAAITDSPLKFLTITPEDFVWAGKNLPKTPVAIDDPELGSVQCIAKIEGLKVAPSSKEWQKKLEQSGLRSINNLVDITNLIMLEYGQPLHAFDAKYVLNETIKVRLAKKNEKITTLDGKERSLDSTDIVLADTEKPLDVAGVMGGKDTEVKDSTSTILLSASLFNPTMVRKTCKRLGLYSEASKRFQHGLSKFRLLQALDASIKMYISLGGKLTSINFLGNFSQTKKVVEISVEQINKLLGEKLDEETILKCLKKLNFTLEKKSGNIIEVTPPYFRLDINIQEDVAEEIARIYGYEKITGKPLDKEVPIKIDQTLPQYIFNLKEKLKEAGLTEVQTYSFFSSQSISNLGLARNTDNLVRIANPISTETEYMRTDIWPNLLEIVNKNMRKGVKDIAVFEIGKVYLLQKGTLPKESYRLSIALTNETDNPLAELYQTITSSTHLPGVRVNPDKAPIVITNLFHPNRLLTIEKGGKQIGVMAEVHLELLNKYGIDRRVAVLEIEVGI